MAKTKLYPIIFLLQVFIVQNSFSQYNSDARHDQRFVGYWKVVSAEVGGQPPPYLLDDHYEIYKTGVVVQRNERNNSYQNVRGMRWYVDKDTVDMLEYKYKYTLRHDTLTLKTYLTPEVVEQQDYQTSLQKVVLKKVSQDPLVNYKKVIAPFDATGNWVSLNFDPSGFAKHNAE